MCESSTNWLNERPRWGRENCKLITGTLVELVNDIKLDELIYKSDKFPIDFPIETIRCRSLKSDVTEDILDRNINSAYPVVHEKTLHLYTDFLIHKRKLGSQIETQLYHNMSLEQFVDRLLTKRAVAFVGRNDQYMLMDGMKRVGHWEKVGKPDEEPPLTLENCLSYDEIKLSALLSVSSYTHFINLGDRDNCGQNEVIRSKIQDEGVIVGLIGARFEKPHVMEYQDIVISKEQNIQENGYGQTFAPTWQGLSLNFYGEMSLTYKEMQSMMKENPVKYTKLTDEKYFNNVVYERRIALSIDTLLIEANQRAKSNNKMAYVHVVGIGLGVWRVSSHQNNVFLDTCAKRIEFLSESIKNVSDVCFSYIRGRSCGKYRHGSKIDVADHLLGGIKIHIFNREPHVKLCGKDAGKLLVVSYAWDGNALPGNEFWWGQLAASGDPAAASSTQVAELHNPHINPNVSGANLKVATFTGLISLKEFQDKIMWKYSNNKEDK